jgi:hypothetical protein
MWIMKSVSNTASFFASFRLLWWLANVTPAKDLNMSVQPQPDHLPKLSRKSIEIELLALDLKTCTRCVGTLGNIEQAVAMLKDVLESTGTEVRLNKVLVESEAQAKALRFVTSPTIRINGKEIVFQTRESKCDSCSDLCGCAEGTSCRVWEYRGQQFDEAPVGLVVEAILTAVFGGGRTSKPLSPFTGISDNLKQFFSGTERLRERNDACCSPTAREVCCEEHEKEACCGTQPSQACGCV